MVPYNALLSTLLNCHINVECTASIRAVKYLYKYVYKGPDMVRMRVQGEQGGSMHVGGPSARQRALPGRGSAQRPTHHVASHTPQ